MSQPSESDLNRFAWRVEELQHEIARRDPHRLANNTATTYQELESGQGAFIFPYWGAQVELAYPSLVARRATGEEYHLFEQAMLLYYFRTADGCAISGQWISFSELPDGRFYNQAFQGYTGRELASIFENDQAAFQRAAASLNGTPGPLGDSSFIFQALPRVSILVVHWQGDEDFPASFKLLFDSSANHYLPTDGYAILGSTLTRRLIKNAE